MTKPFYNIGAGSFSHPDWQNLDLPSEHYAAAQQPNMIPYDLMDCRPLPIETGEAKIIYCSHTLEHVPNEPVMNALRESYRALGRGGVLRVVVPDAELIYRSLQNSDEPFFFNLAKLSHAESGLEAFLDMFGSEHCVNNEAPSEKWTDEVIAEVIHAHEDRDALLEFIARESKFNPEHPQNHVNWFTPEKLMAMMRDAGFQTVYRSGMRQSARPEMRSKDFDPWFFISLYMEAVR